MKRNRIAVVIILVLLATVLFACGKDIDFKVSFEVDGEVYYTISTLGDEAITMPPNPAKEGHIFQGWYWDKDVWNEPFTANSLLNEPLKSNMVVYAKFEVVTNNEEEGFKSFTDILFADKTVDYNGSEHIIVCQGLPEGAEVVYANNKGIDAGSYNASAVISKDGYNDLTLTATLTINKIDFTNIVFADVDFDYDGSEKQIIATGVPDFATVVYSNNIGTDAGTYTATVTVTNNNYKKFSKSATLIINKIALSAQYVFDSETFEYDEAKHAISVTGAFPAGVSVTYSGGEDGKNAATNVGSYIIIANISGKNYITQTLEATLKIKSSEEKLYAMLDGDNLYFQNTLDKKRLYVYDGAEITKVNNEKPEYFTKVGDSIYYFSPNILSSSIASFDGTNSESLFEVNGEHLTTDGTYLYFAVTSFIKPEKTGIFKISIADLNNSNIDPTPIKLTQDKAEYLVYANGYIYYSNKNDGGKLYRIATTADNGTSECVYDYKISDMIVSDNVLYFTRHFTLSNLSEGAAIYRIDVGASIVLPLTDESAEVKKITMSKGKYLVKAGEYIYFVNTDMVTTTIFGDGIYRAKADGSGWTEDIFTLLIGSTKVIDGENNNVYSLTTDGTNIYYYRTNDKHLYMYNGSEEIDIMDGFIAPVETKTIITYYEKSQQYNDELYYINMRDGGRLYKYSPTTNDTYRITGLQVADFKINGDYLYYATVRFGVNFDLYKLNLINGELDRISTDKCFNLAFINDTIYYANFSGSNTLNNMNLDGAEDKVVFDEKSVNDWNIIAYDNKVYFVADGNLYCYDLSSQTASIVNNDVKPNEYMLFGDDFYMMNDKATNYFIKYNISNNTLTEITSLGFTNDARSIFVFGGDIYFYRNVAAGSSNKGLYKVDTTATNLTAELVTSLDGYNMSSAQVIGGRVYFFDVWQVKGSVPTPTSTGKLCTLDLATNTVIVVAE